MKKGLCLMLAVLLTAVCAGALAMTPGSYTAQGEGRNGAVVVTVTLTQEAIESVVVDSHKEDEGFGGRAIEAIPEAIVESQSLAVDTVTGATLTTNAILTAVEAALTQAGADLSAFKPAQAEAAPGQTLELTADVVVLGAGGAGVAAAIEAYDAGASVVLLEKMSAIGGTTATSQGMIGGYETKFTKALNVHHTYEEMYANLMSNASYRLDPALTAITVERSGETIDWIADRLEMPFSDQVIVGYGPLQMMHLVDGAGPAMREAMQAALDATDIELMLGTRACEILMNEDGSVRGVRAERGADTVIVLARGVIVATGGYAYNPELTVLLDPEKAGTMGIGFEGALGEGIIMASNVGAALTHTGDMMCVLKDYEIMAEHNGNSATANVSSFISRGNTVLVGADGKRFVDEKDIGYMTQKLNGPVFDQMHKDSLGYVWAISDKASLEAANVARGLGMEFITADTFEELAAQMGLDAQALATTLENYNGYCETGHDPEFGRLLLEPLAAPYCAVRVMPCEIITYGGNARNERAEVIRADGTAIPGLYTAGEASANSAYMGFTISNAFTWGRIAGGEAAAYAKAE